MYIVVEDDYKSYLISAGITSGYLFDFNKEFSNQFRLSPHLYAEFGLFVVKAGYDYLLPLQQGTPFISIGLGGGYLFRHFKIMRSEEHTSELQSRPHLVCRLLLEKKKIQTRQQLLYRLLL